MSTAPKEMLVRISRLSVDADGSERAYHPDDPSGRGVCTREKGPDGKEKLSGICALDAFSSGGLRLYRDTTLIPLMTKVDGKNILNADFDREWKSVWPQVREKKLKAFTLESLTSRSVPAFYYLFYDKARKTTIAVQEQHHPDRQGRLSVPARARNCVIPVISLQRPPCRRMARKRAAMAARR